MTTTPHPEDMPERKAFEAFCMQGGRPRPINWDEANTLQEVPESLRGKYIINSVQQSWEAWQARASLAEQRTREMRELLREWQQAYNGMDRGDGILTADFQSLRRRTHEALYQPRACKPQPSTELPGMWEQADLSGGATDSTPPSAPGKGEAEGWRPIETAPKDGTHILVSWPMRLMDDDGMPTGEITRRDTLVTWMNGDAWIGPDYLGASGEWYGDDDCYAADPDLWQPLPTPPSHPGPLERMQKIDDEMGIEP